MLVSPVWDVLAAQKAAVSTDAGEARAAKKARKAVDSAKEAQKLQSEKVKNDPSLYCKYYFKVCPNTLAQ